VAKYPKWLNRQLAYDYLGKKNKYKTYRRFVELVIDDELSKAHNAGDLKGVLAGEDFASDYAPIFPCFSRPKIAIHEVRKNMNVACPSLLSREHRPA
jgi:hypothetical protein